MRLLADNPQMGWVTPVVDRAWWKIQLPRFKGGGRRSDMLRFLVFARLLYFIRINHLFFSFFEIIALLLRFYVGIWAMCASVSHTGEILTP